MDVFFEELLKKYDIWNKVSNSMKTKFDRI